MGQTRGRDTTKKQIASSASDRDTTKKPVAAKRIAKKPATESDDDRKTTIAADSNESNQGSEQEEEEEEEAEEEVAEESPGHGDGDDEEVENGDDESECGECFGKIREGEKRYKSRRLHNDCGGAVAAIKYTLMKKGENHWNVFKKLKETDPTRYAKMVLQMARRDRKTGRLSEKQKSSLVACVENVIRSTTVRRAEMPT